MSRILSVIAILCLCIGIPHGRAQDDEIETKFDKSPVPMKTPPPRYPEQMKGAAGLVSVVLIIDEAGNVAKATVSKSSDPAFEAPTIDAIQKWKFKPAEKDGQPVKSKVIIPIRFNGQ